LLSQPIISDSNFAASFDFCGDADETKPNKEAPVQTTTELTKGMTMPIPLADVGRMVLFHGHDGRTYPATICRVFENERVNLAILNDQIQQTVFVMTVERSSNPFKADIGTYAWPVIKRKTNT
jgi:hypothetical protein